MPDANKKEFDAIFRHLELVTSQLKHMEYPSEVSIVFIPKGHVFSTGETWTDVIINAAKHIDDNVNAPTKTPGPIDLKGFQV